MTITSAAPVADISLADGEACGGEMYKGHYLVIRPDGYRGGWQAVYFYDFAANLRGEQLATRFTTEQRARQYAYERIDTGPPVRVPPVPLDVMTPSRRTLGIRDTVGPFCQRPIAALFLRHGDAPALPDGLDIDRASDGTWFTVHESWAAALTCGHVAPVEARWAAHALRDAAPWPVTIDVTQARLGEPERTTSAREGIARKVARIDQAYARWRGGPVNARPPDKTLPCTIPGLTLERFGRGEWGVYALGRRLGYTVGSEAKVRDYADRVGPMADWTLPPYMLAADLTLHLAVLAAHGEVHRSATDAGPAGI